ncbi:MULTISPECIES: hypothetical protein [Burkholderia cepacia complex]|jgi:hypothetical protein|uniref:Lipoprotein n=1 Tax=Burkholderia cenocepacia TaxID=95486 RepID=A0ABD4UG02_9BURK|nr:MULTISPECIES: hypothetical protein [Burkholderia cepacia complex]MCW3696653.1 hypothetical protein [Burkholderia cenocepacia]MCW3704869.1 hypothetical protein [Burkholderia cenocepacia]MCW3713129.1 hypothetical protein [Burkholderia cenocepacia]MCW3725216.1 hypothetical protein [Burkholderia cenocepacia]MCW3729121.1 hypothetical protein [Burkholderia cenocepacia]
MRLISAALLGAAASLPALVHATTTMPDPTDAAASVPAVTAPAAFDGYRPYNDAANPSWQQLNQSVREKPAEGGMTHGGTMNQPTGDHRSNHSQHGEPAK